MTATACLRVLLVEDSTVLAERLAELINPIADVELVGVVDTESGAIAALKREPIDVVILDLHLKQGTGFGVMRAMSRMPHKARVVVLTNYDLPEYQNAALGLGASYFLDKARDYVRLPQVMQELREAHRAGS
jgi:two-component system OmpR family response regulator